MNNKIVNVWFKIFYGDVLAIFENGYECNPNRLMSYQHIGQHSECSKTLKFLRNATEKEYKDLYDELVEIGYELNVINWR